MPYQVPFDTEERSKIPGKIHGLNCSYTAFATPEDNELMATIILYPHVDSAGKSDILRRVHNHKNKPVQKKIIFYGINVLSGSSPALYALDVKCKS
jgi:hypothetical protein